MSLSTDAIDALSVPVPEEREGRDCDYELTMYERGCGVHMVTMTRAEFLDLKGYLARVRSVAGKAVVL